MPSPRKHAGRFCPVPKCVRVVGDLFCCTTHYYSLSVSARSALWRTTALPADDPVRAEVVRRALLELETLDD